MAPAYKKTVLDNGLKVVTFPMTQRRSTALGIWITVGGRYEDAPQKGMSHVLEHLLFKGSRRFSCRRIKESIEGVGGALNGFTSEELTCYLVKIPAAHLDTALSVLADMVCHPLLRQEDIAKEKTVILEELKMYRDLPQSYVHELLDELLWPGQPLGMPVIGTVESVSSVTRAALAAFKTRHYIPANIVVSAAGVVDHHALVGRLRRIFSAVRQGTPSHCVAAQETHTHPQLKVFAKETEQTHLALGFHGVRRDHPLRYPLALLHVILGGNMSSRLFNEVREKRGLAYEIGTQLKRFCDTGAFVVHAGIDNHKVIDAVALILAELGKTTRRLVTGDELRRAKDFYLGQILLALEDTLEHMLWIGESTATLDTIYRVDELIRQIRRVSVEEVRSAARQIFAPDKINLALIGPLAGLEEQLRPRLHWG